MIYPDDLGPLGPWLIAAAWAAALVPYFARHLRTRRATRKARR